MFELFFCSFDELFSGQFLFTLSPTLFLAVESSSDDDEESDEEEETEEKSEVEKMEISKEKQAYRSGYGSDEEK